MSRIGKQPVEIPSGVNVVIEPKQITVTGSKGTLSQPKLPGLKFDMSDDTLSISRIDDQPVNRSKHGLMRSLVNNMVLGVSSGFSKQLEVNGVGYKAALSGNVLKLSLGFSHQISYQLPEGISAGIEQNIITISGIDKQQVGQVAAEIRSLKKPEPYKGKGIKYVGERIIRKSGKSGKDK